MNSNSFQLAGTSHDNLQIAIETTGMTGSLAVLRGETVLRHRKLDSGRRTAAALAPVLAETLQWCGETKKKLQVVSIADGPGSFTGLRIGVTTAKTLGYALDLPLIAVDSLAAIAAVTFAEQPEMENLLVAINAYRGQVFTAKFRRAELLIPLDTLAESVATVNQRADNETSPWTPHPEQVRIVDAGRWRQISRAAEPGDYVTGDQKVFKQFRDVSFVHRVMPDSVGVGLLAVRASILRSWCHPLELVPRYLRPSAAEEKADRQPSPLKPRSA